MENDLNNGIKAVIYDCDGVLFDSFEANYAFYHLILERFGRPPLDRADEETMRILHTYSNKVVLERIFAGCERMDEVRAFSASLDYRKLFPLMVMEDGLRETLDALKGRVELAVCTNRSSSMEALLSTFGLDGYFSLVMTAARVRNPKPHPEPVFKVLEHYGIAPEEAIFIGDSEVDQRAAEGAGVRFVSYRGDFPAQVRIEKHQDLLSLL